MGKGHLRFFAVICTFIISVSSINLANAANPKPGASCSKKGVVQVVNNKKFTCYLKGKKLVWDSGISVVKISTPSSPSVLPTPTPTPTPSPTTSSGTDQTKPPVIDTKWYAWRFRINSKGVLERKSEITSDWTANPSRPGIEVDPVRLKAFEAIKKYGDNSDSASVNVNLYFSSNVDADLEKTYRIFLTQSINYFSSLISNTTTLDVIVATEKDDDYRSKILHKVLSNQQEADDQYARETSMYHQFDGPNAISQSGGGTLSGTAKMGQFLFSGAVCSCFRSENLLMYNIPHEITHFYQFATTPTVPKQNFISSNPLIEGKIYIPNWLMEGSANTFGSAITVQHVGWYSDQMDWHLGRYKRDHPEFALKSDTAVVEALIKTESWLPPDPKIGDLNYPIGQLVTEYLLAQYGVERYFSLFANLQKLRDFDDAVAATFNKSKLDLYFESAPYVMKAFNKVTN